MHTASSLESTAKLQEAIRTLKNYSLQQTAFQRDSSIAQKIAGVRAIFADRLDAKMLQAIELINRHRFLIEKLKAGTVAERLLADEFTRTIDTYNENCNKRIHGYVSNRLTNFFSKHQRKQEMPKIALPKKTTIQCIYPEHPITQRLHTFPITSTQSAIPISQQSAELFQMKAIALLERYGIASNSEARASVKHSPIYTLVEQDSCVCTLKQTLSLLPGQTITVMGTSELDPKTHAISRLFPETFCLSLESSQTGCPHPLQRAGWTLASQLIPEFPQRIDLLKETAPLFHGKSRAIVELSPQGGLLKRAKELLSLKKRCFNQHAKEFLELHKKLAFAIAKNADREISEIDLFFDHVATLNNPFEYLADTSQMIRENFMAEPYHILLDAIIKAKSTGLCDHSPEIRYSTAKSLLDQAFISIENRISQQKLDTQSDDERIQLDYISCMGGILKQASKQIVLQYLSEDLVFPPPLLTAFERQLQATAYVHLRDFLNELSPPSGTSNSYSLTEVYENMRKQIEDDFAIFQEEKKLSIPDELAEYFQGRYNSVLSLSS